MGGSEQKALRASDDVFSSSQGVWQKLEGQGKVGSPLLSCQARPTSKGQPTSNCRACQQSKQVLATGDPDSLPPTWHVVRGKEMHTHLESPPSPMEEPRVLSFTCSHPEAHSPSFLCPHSSPYCCWEAKRVK